MVIQRFLPTLTLVLLARRLYNFANTSESLMQYNPAEPMDADHWLSLDEGERLYAIQRWLSELIGSEIDDCLIGAAPILAVENQLAMNDPPITRATLDRFLSAGIDRVIAIQVISDVMADSMAAAVSGDPDYDAKAYAQALEQIDPSEIALDDPEEEVSGKPAGGLPEFNAEHRRVLVDFAERHADKEAMSWPETAGFLFAVQACPDMVMPSEWLEIVQGQAVFDDIDEAKAVSEARMALMNWVSDCIQDGQPAIPADCLPDPDPFRILEADNDFSRWCRGVMEGHHWLEQSWDAALTIDSDDDRALGMSIVLFSFFTDRKMAERVVEEMARHSSGSSSSFEELIRKFHPLVESAAVEYAAIGLEYRQAPPVPEPPSRQPVRSQKIGRNQPCPCGSGKKYKKCCGQPGATRFH
jgi:uncharacterized protein